MAEQMFWYYLYYTQQFCKDFQIKVKKTNRLNLI